MSYSNGLLSDQSYQTANKYVQRGLPGVGFKLTDTGDYDMQNKKLTNVKSGTDPNDAVNKSQLDASTNLLHGSRAGDVVNDKAVIYSNTGAVHANSLYIEDPPDQGNSNEVRIMTEHQSYPNIHLNIPDLHNFDGQGGRPKSELMVTSVEQTVTGKKVFENIEVHDPTSNNQAANKSYADTKLSLTGGTMTGDLILPHHNYPIPGNTNKVINYESQREIFLSRQESFPMQADINMNNNFIQNIATPTSSHQVTNKGYCDYNFLNRQKGGVIMGPLSMNQNDLTGIPDTPKFGYSAVNKNYVDAKIPSVDSTQFVKKAGDQMIGDLDMGSHFVKNVGINLSDDTTVVPRSYVDSFANSAIHNPLEIDLYASNFQIKQLKIPTDVQDAINKKYFDEELLKSHLLPSHIENAFKYLSDQDESSSERNIIVNGIQDYNGSPHKNKKAYDIDLIYTSGTQNYDSKIGINLYPLPVGKFTIIMEYYFPEDINISLLAEASTAIINKQTITNFLSYKKQLVQINQQTKDTPDYLFFTIRGSGTTATNPEGYLVFYGVKEWVDTVPSEIYDHVLETGMFEYDNGNMKIFHDIDLNNNKIINSSGIDMNNHKIENLSDATNTNDAINKGQLDIVLNKLNELIPHIKNHRYRAIFKENFYDLTETHNFVLKSNVDNVIIQRVKPNLNIDTDLPISSFSSNGLLFNHRIRLYYSDMYSSGTPVTFFMSFIHNTQKTGTIFFSHESAPTQPTSPIFLITPDKIIIIINRVRHEHLIPADLINKKIFIWICYIGGGYTSPISKMSIGNEQSYIQGVMTRGRAPSHTLSINYDVIVNNIGIINRFYDINSPEHHQIILEEKLNGTKLI